MVLIVYALGCCGCLDLYGDVVCVFMITWFVLVAWDFAGCFGLTSVCFSLRFAVCLCWVKVFALFLLFVFVMMRFCLSGTVLFCWWLLCCMNCYYFVVSLGFGVAVILLWVIVDYFVAWIVCVLCILCCLLFVCCFRFEFRVVRVGGLFSFFSCLFVFCWLSCVNWVRLIVYLWVMCLYMGTAMCLTLPY